MRSLIAPVALIVSLAVGSSAFAATAPAKTAPVVSKASACAAQWKAEKKHTQTRKAFLSACEKKA